MAKYVCPSCGAPFDGKKCRNCAYENFSEEIAHNLHVHKGEPLVIKDTTRKRVPYKDPFSCPGPRRETKKSAKITGLPKALLIIFLIIFMINVLTWVFAAIGDHADWPEPEPSAESVSLPLNGKTLFEDNRFTIIAQWQDGKSDSTYIPVYIINHTDKAYDFSSKNVTVNGFCLDDFSGLYAQVQPGETLESGLHFSDQGLQLANIAQIQQISFSLEATAFGKDYSVADSLDLGTLFILHIQEIRDLMIEKTDKLDKMLKQVAKVLASNTNYATMISVPQYSGSKIKFIQLSRVTPLQLVAVVVSDNNVIRNQIINLDEEMDDQTILKLNLLLNTNLNGVPIQDINLGMIARLKEQAGVHGSVVGTVLDAVADTIQVDEDDMQIYTSGATNIFKYPELADTSKASELISAFEEKQDLVDLVKERMSDTENTGIQVYIGDEMPVQTMKDCSVVTATYELGKGMHGTIGIIGPKRMDYANVVDSLKALKVQLDELIKKES